MKNNKEINVLLAVCGGIAAYKAAELVRLLIKKGCKVRVVMTSSAGKFVTPLTFQALSGNPVHSDLLDEHQESVMGHISLSRWADVIIIAPATANTIAKIAHGLADDLVSALCLATESPVFLAPAMNQAMWSKSVTQKNILICKNMGIDIIGPESGSQACGETGFGRMSEPDEICSRVLTDDSIADLTGRTVLITAGPTRESLDPVRYITNRSSGKMGYALALAASQAGASVILVSGPVVLSPPVGVETLYVETADQMYKAVFKHVKTVDIFIGAAAVADYAPVNQQHQKIKKQGDNKTIELQKTRDILAEVAKMSDSRPYTVGFAAETNDLKSYAIDKLNLKNLDMVAANWVGREQGGFESDVNALEVYWQGGSVNLEMMEKNRLARKLIALIAERMNEKNTA